MATPTLSAVTPQLKRKEAALAKLDGGAGPASGPTTWKAWQTRDEALTKRLEGYKPPAATPQPPPTGEGGGTPTQTPPPASTKPPSPLSVPAEPVILPTTVLPTDRVAKVIVRLTQPLRRPVVYRFVSWNGTVYAPQYFDQNWPILTFLTGETEKTVDIKVPKGLQPGENFHVALTNYSSNPEPAGASGIVQGGTTRPAIPPNPHPAPVFAAPKLNQGKTLKWETDFLGPIGPNSVPGQLRTREGWGRWRNNELAPYADATTDPGTNPHPVEMVDGKLRRILRAEHVATKERVPGSQTATFDLPFSASELQSEDVYLFPVGGCMHIRFKSGRAQGTTLAIWFCAQTNEYYEIDVLENGLGWNANDDMDNFASTIHGYWGTEGVGFANPLADGQWHEIWYSEEGGEMITVLDGNVIMRRPNPYPYRPRLPFIVNVSVGGITDAPRTVGPGWKSDMVLDFARFYE